PGEADGEGDEVRPAELEGEPADDETCRGGHEGGSEEAEPRRPLEPDAQETRRVGADAEESRMAEGELAGVTEQEVQAQGEDREDPRHDQRVQVVGIPHPGWRGGRRGEE